MAEANATVPHPTAEITAARRAIEWTLAQQQARKHVVEEIKRRGYKLAEYEARDITVLAKDYLTQHPSQCFARAREIIEGSPVLQRMARRWEREKGRRSVRKDTRNRTLAAPKAHNVEVDRTR
jgi:hypothetical protein